MNNSKFGSGVILNSINFCASVFVLKSLKHMQSFFLQKQEVKFFNDIISTSVDYLTILICTLSKKDLITFYIL